MLRVVIADDVEDSRWVVRLVLEADGHFEVVAEAGNGIDAIKLVGDELPDAVVLDLDMPIMDGLEAISEIRKLSPNSKILVFSSFESSMVDRAMDLGADGYVEKGCDVGTIPEKLLSLL